MSDNTTVADAIADFTYRLRRARRDAGDPSLRDLAQRVKFTASVSTLQRAFSGAALPAWRVVEALLLKGFNVDERAVNDDWRPAWVAVKDLVDPLDPPVRPVGSSDVLPRGAVVSITSRLLRRTSA